jgi:bacillithiol biosynthesis cysteine-adding enzyme BshC
LKIQNNSLPLSKSSKENIDLLKLDNTFSVTTGHQLCMFTGPLYFIYKIISTINLCEQLTAKYPSNNFVPICWMATEDHDFKEVNHIHLFGKKIEWDSQQTGAVGKMNLDGFESLISELRLILGSHKNTDKLITLFEQAYLNHDNLADATMYLVNELFGKYGLVIIDGNDKDLKKQFISQIKKDILKSGFVATIQNCSNSLAKNYKAQAFIRDINFFKLSEGKRELIKENITEIEIEENPERFSPNVLLRPLYQEIILPNIAYIGGEAEVAYWMQLKTAFEQEKIPFPLLVLRHSVLLIDEKKQHTFEKLGFELEDLFLSEDELNKRYVLAHSNSEISLVNEKIDFDLLYQKIALKTSDVGFQNSIKAQLQKQRSYLDTLQEKLIRIEKKKNETAISQIAKIKKQLFPNNALQERCNNFIPYYLQDGDNFIKILKNNFDPLNPNFVILTLKN